ncbi:lytic transglycosylase domain-containing protein [Longimicrobium sp.]|uniref:lytic transglycosylase domain-containing protein n=1 Tax=Longimicrobium sp. TaxID=2029185 RepID=UPI002ED8A768
MSTTADCTRPLPGALRVPALVAALALCAWGMPARAQQADSATVAPASTQAAESINRDFWRWVRDRARQVREMSGGPFAFAMQFRISPQLARTIHDAAESQGLDPELGFRLVRAESAFNPRARSHAGALGYTQLMPSTARWLDRRMTTRERILEPEPNLRVGFGYLRRLIDKYDGDVRLALLAYNRGEGAVDRDLRSGRNPENGYTRRVLGMGRDRYQGPGRR